MKKILGISAVILFTLLSFGVSNYVAGKQTAEVSKIDDIYIFMDCKPVQKYEVLGEAKSAVTDDYEGFRDDLINKVKRKYPNAEAIILHYPHQNLPKAEAIKFVD